MIAAHKEGGLSPPEHLFPPELSPDESELLEAWSDLCSDRPTGMSIGSIPFTSIDRWAARYGFDDLERFDLLRRAIRSMDAVYLGWKSEQLKKGA